MSPARVGAFVVGALVLVIVAMTALGSGRLFRRQHFYVMYFSSSVNGLHEGSPVKFRGVQIGSVTRILLSLNQLESALRSRDLSRIRMPVLVELNEQKILSRGGKNLDLDDPRTLKDLIAAGLRGQLAIESLLTGMLYVELDMHPGTPIDRVLPPGARYEEIPTLPTALEKVQREATEVVAHLSRVDLDRLADSTIRMADSIRALASSPKLASAIDNLNSTTASLDKAVISIQQMADKLRVEIPPMSKSVQDAARNAIESLQQAHETLVTAQATFIAAKGNLDAGSPMTYQLGKTLEDISAAAQATRELAQFLERNPSAIVRGRAVSRDGQ